MNIMLKIAFAYALINIGNALVAAGENILASEAVKSGNGGHE